jgi:hypothetical protein
VLGVSSKYSTGLTIHKNLFLSTIDDSSVRASGHPNTPLSGSPDHSRAGSSELTREHRKTAPVQNFPGHYAGLLTCHTDHNITRGKSCPVHASLQIVCSKQVSRADHQPTGERNHRKHQRQAHHRGAPPV